jgi:hypothetical protein
MTMNLTIKQSNSFKKTVKKRHGSKSTVFSNSWDDDWKKAGAEIYKKAA